MRPHSSWKTNSAEFRTRVTRHPHCRGGTDRHHSRAGRSQSTDRKCNVGLVMNQQRTIVKLFQIIMNHVTEQIETPQIQCAEKRDPLGAVFRHDHVHKMQKPLKLPQVQCINKTSQKVQQITEVSHQQYMDMNVDVPAEMQCQNTATRRHCRRLRKHNGLH